MGGRYLPAGAGDARYTVTVRIDPAEVDRALTDPRWRRVKLGMPLARVLQAEGFVVPEWRTALACASVVGREAEGGLVLTVTAPRPHHVPDGELNAEDTITVEYVGGADDGLVEPLRLPGAIPPSTAISLNSCVYTRWSYDLAEGVWLYRLRPGTAHDPHAEVEDDGVWTGDDD